MALNLKYGTDDAGRHLRTAFDEDAANYDAVRPRYCKALFEAIFDGAQLDKSALCLEIGPGTGQATEPFLNRGCRVTAVELGENLAQYLAWKYRDLPNLSVWNGDFLDFPEEQRYDLIYSATAFHWIPREQGLEKVKRLLKPGGTLALFWNHPIPGGQIGTPAEQAVSAVYEKHGKGGSKKIFDGSTCPAYCDSLRAAGFRNVGFQLFESQRVLSGTQYVQLMRSYSDHANLNEAQRQALEGDMLQAIEGLGDGLPILDRMDLYLATI